MGLARGALCDVLSGICCSNMKIRIVHIQVLPILSGVQNISLQILSQLDDEKYEKYFICAADSIESTAFNEQFSMAGVKIIRLKNLRREIGWHDAKVLWELYQLCRELNFDIVHTHSTKPGIVGRIAARLAGVKAVIHTVHGVAFHKNETPVKRVFYYSAEYFAGLFGHYITSVNHYYLRYFRWFPNKNISVIHNGVDINVPMLHREPICNLNGIKTILFLSRLDKAKDPMTLLAAINILAKKFNRRDFVLNIAGDGEYLAEAQEYVNTQKIADYVQFLGWVDDKETVYRDADIFCVPSIFEAFGLVFAEAGLYELPTLATRVEGIPEVIKDGHTGLLVESRDPIALATGLVQLLDEPELRKTLGQNARQYVIQNFSHIRMFDSYQQLYIDALNK
jgi:glycosyltransferase involved in cell wall biosynthesis